MMFLIGMIVGAVFGGVVGVVTTAVLFVGKDDNESAERTETRRKG